jgi:hypothetical protein
MMNPANRIMVRKLAEIERSLQELNDTIMRVFADVADSDTLTMTALTDYGFRMIEFRALTRCVADIVGRDQSDE